MAKEDRKVNIVEVGNSSRKTYDYKQRPTVKENAGTQSVSIVVARVPSFQQHLCGDDMTMATVLCSPCDVQAC